MKPPVRRWALLIATLVCLSANARDAESDPAVLLVFAAASLTNVLEELSTEWERTTGVPVKLSFAASSVLARQIESGGNADVFVSADREWMDYLEARRLIATDSRRNVAGNSLVLIAPADSQTTLQPGPGSALAEALNNGRLAVADTETVPAGRYARAALTSLGIWDSVSNRLARAENVRTALNYVARGESPLGIVYSTDAQIDPKVRIVATFPDSSHPAISYPAAATLMAGRQSAAYLAFLVSPTAAPIWKKYGFREPSP